MSTTSPDGRAAAELRAENEQLRRRLEEAEQTLEAIRHGDVDAVVVSGPHGDQVFSLTGAEHAYRLIVETMHEAALTVGLDGGVRFCNQRFSDLVRTPMSEILGQRLAGFAAAPQAEALRKLLADAQAGPVQRRVLLRAADGTAVPVQAAASLLTVNAEASLCLVLSDLTELESSANSIRVLREHEQALEQTQAELRQRAEELRASNQELERFNRAMVDRELRMIELKQQVNDLRRQLGQPPCYPLENLQPQPK